MSIFGFGKKKEPKEKKKKKLPPYMVEVDPPVLEDTSDMHGNMDRMIDAYKKRVYRGTHLNKVFQDAHAEVKKMTDGELAASYRNGWTTEMLVVYLLKIHLVEALKTLKTENQRKEIYAFNKQLMSRATEIRLATRSQAKEEDRTMREKCGITD